MSMTFNKQRGAVALITTMMFSVLITLIIMAMFSLMISEQRQQTNDEQALTANLAAESGLEDALHKLVVVGLNGNLPAGANSCQPVNSPFSGVAAKVTCQYISKSSSPAGKLTGPDIPVQIDSGSGYNVFTLSWDDSSGHPATYYQFPIASCNVGACPGASGYAPPMEIQIAQYPTGTFPANSGSVALRNVLFVPTTGAPTAVSYASLLGNNPVMAKCTPGGGGYHCQATINGLDQLKNYIFRIHSRYTGTNYSAAFFLGAVQKVVPDGSYTIDITAGSGSSTRRVLYKVPYTKAALGGLDFVIYSDNNVCKDFDSLGGGLPTTPNNCH